MASKGQIGALHKYLENLTSELSYKIVAPEEEKRESPPIPPLLTRTESSSSTNPQNEIDEISQNLQQISSKHKTVIRISDPVPNSQPLQTATYPYFNKNLLQLIIMIEDEYLEKESKLVAKKILPLNWQFPPSDIRKTQKFYEDILIETKSIAVKHYKFQNIDAYTHSTVQILSVLTPLHGEIISMTSENSHKIMNPNILITGIILQHGPIQIGRAHV